MTAPHNAPAGGPPTGRGAPGSGERASAAGPHTPTGPVAPDPGPVGPASGPPVSQGMGPGGPDIDPGLSAESAPAPRVIGLDLSMTCTGIALVDGSTDTIKTRDGTGDWRLVNIRRRIHGYVTAPPVGLVVIEDVPPIRGHSLAIIGMVHGIVRELLTRTGIPYALVPPTNLKKYATGTGGANKPDMRVALLKRTGIDRRDDNEVDAWWLRAMGLDHLGRPPLRLPKTHRDALAKVRWPQM